MKNFCIIFLSLFIISVTTVGFLGVLPAAGRDNGENGEYLRIHIRADSNEAAAQTVKYAVRDEVVDYLTPLVASYATKRAAMEGIEKNLPQIERVATEVLQKEGFSYGAQAKLTKESFPTRVYGEYVLPAGEYSALVLSLGSGKGDNWWCVVYPPLCFSGTPNVIYKSKIKEIIDGFYTR